MLRPITPLLRATLACALGACLALAARAAPPEPGVLPAPVQAALARAQVPREALSAVVLPVDGGRAALAWQAGVPRNPASVMKLVTTYAALELLGPAYTWQTPVYLGGAVQGGVLAGDVYIQGQGDPKLVAERLWLLLRRLQAQGIKVIRGDIVLDHGAFHVPARDAAAFDGEPWRPYNVAPDALLVNFNALTLDFIPDPQAGVARVAFEPPLAAMQVPSSVPLAPRATACGDWRAGLRGDFAQPGHIALQGSYPAACGERQWPVAPAEPEKFAARAVEGMWRALGGSLTGRVRDGQVPEGLQPAFASTSPALAEVVRDINKYSNNVMAQQLLLTLALHRDGSATPETARAVVADWWAARGGAPADLVMDNGAGLSREGRVTAQALADMLRQAWASPVMPELLSSLPITGIDGTLRRRQGQARGAAHLKTGSLRDVVSVAGFVHAASGRRYVLVALVNHANAGAARPALDALVDWVWAGE
ncbi:MAG: D-alanyl-D-alanine carboxypeptidase/D-alanyl-D-alanine-endopeptidase [Comamonadaceae bacterium]|nr:D-alanyl-D-alanine carboxypeptidase/D-alanyl-D-alanine-endopeptidase [Burkholderiales bacterium]MEB2349748.1 D-alanyl-D-alanine carboxypeptidase/D-alanyl-D-alanine-endopeptidase [Comamonadaceae bacterium]